MAIRPLRFLPITALSLSLLLPAQAQPLTLGEQYALRAYTGQAFGRVMSNLLDVDSPLILTNVTSICSALSTAMAAQLVSVGGSPAIVAAGNPEDMAKAVRANLDAPAVALIFGGQATVEENYALVRAALRELANADYEGPIFFHLRVWVPKLPERAAKEDPNISAYLANKSELYTAVVDANRRRVVVHQATVSVEGQKLVRQLRQLPMNERWLDLFRRSI